MTLFHRYSLLTGLDLVQADTGDSRFIAFLLEHWNTALHAQADLRSPPIFYPVQGTLAYSDVLAAMGLIHAALRPFLSLFAAVNLQLILLTLASFAAAYALLVRGFGLSTVSASLGAYFFAFSWPRFAQLVHLQLQFTPLIPVLALLALQCLRDGPAMTRRWFAVRASAFVALLVLLLATTFYYALFVALALTVAVTLCLLWRAGRVLLAATLRRHWLALLGAALLAGFLAAPLVALYLPVIRESGGRPWAEVLLSLPRPFDFLWMGRENWAWGWLFASWPPDVVIPKWPELRIGVGVVASLLWAVAGARAAGTLLHARRGRRLAGRWPVSACVVIWTGLVLQVLMMRLPGGRSFWWLVWTLFPGAGGIRGVARLELVITLAMAVGFAFLAEDALRARRVWPALGILVGLCAIEQVGRANVYSGREAEMIARQVAAELPRTCRAAFVVGTPDLIATAPAVDQAHFDPGAYLAANPDVAAGWAGSAWEHYVQFGRKEGRLLDPAAAFEHRLSATFYNYTVPLAATLAGVPVVNGLSGWAPPGWSVYDVLSPGAPALARQWLMLNHVPEDWVCTVAVRLDRRRLPDETPVMWP